MQSPVAMLSGVFRVQAEPAFRRVILVADGREGRTEVHFTGVTRHELPEQLENLRIAQLPATGATRTQRLFAIESAGGSWRIEANSVQLHEHPALFGHAVPLPRFGIRQRVLWGSLLWIARFDWGRTLIERLTSKKREATR